MPSSKYWYHFVLFLQTLIVFFRKLTDNISFLCSETVQDYLKFITQKNLEISSRRFREFHGQRLLFQKNRENSENGNFFEFLPPPQIMILRLSFLENPAIEIDKI